MDGSGTPRVSLRRLRRGLAGALGIVPVVLVEGRGGGGAVDGGETVGVVVVGSSGGADGSG